MFHILEEIADREITNDPKKFMMNESFIGNKI